MYGQKTGLEAAVAAAAKVDASLHAKGKLTKSLSEGLSKSDVSKIIQAEFSINDVSQSTRNLLCKGSTQEIIKDFSGACVSTKGRYIPENERKNINLQDKTAKNLGLYLFIQGPSKRSIDLAIQKIKEMIASNADNNASRNTVGGAVPSMGPCPGPAQVSIPPGSGNTPVPVQSLVPDSSAMVRGAVANMPPSLMSLTMQLPPPMMEQHPSGKFIEKIPIGMENVLPGFNLPMKLIGQGGSNLNYIKNETGAIVTLRGIGSAFLEPGTQQEAPEPLHFCITHHKPEVMATARDLALNLIATVQQEYIQFQMQQPPPQNPAVQIQQNVEPPPSLVLHQPGGGEHSIIQQQIPGVTTTSIALPVVQTSFIQQPAVTQLTAPPPMVGVPPPHFSQPPPPPAQVSLPPPGVHIPQQQGPLVSPVPQHLQIQPQHEQPNNFVQQIAQPFQPGQQQYVITQNGQPMQGIMTSQGLVVLNQQPQPTYTQQQVFLSQPPSVGQSQTVFQPGQPLAFQSATNQPIHAAVSAPVSYQFQYVQQNPPPTMTYSAVQNPLQAQPSHLQIQPPQHQASNPPPPPHNSSQSPVPNQHQSSQNNPHVNQPPPSLPNHSPTMQNPPPNQRHSPNLQGPPPNQPHLNFPVQSNPGQMVLQQIPNHQMIPNNQPVPIQNHNLQAVPVSTANFIPGQTQLMQIQGIRPPNEVPNTQFQLQPPNYNQYQQQIVMKQVQVCQPQHVQFVPGYPPGPVQILPAAPGPFIPPPQHQHQHQHQQQQQQQPLPQFNQNQENPLESKPQKRKFTEEISPPLQQTQPPPQSLMSIPMQPPQPVPPPAQAVSNNASPVRQGVGVQELMIMNQQQRQQHLQQPEGLQKDPSQKGEDAAVVPPPPPSAGNQPFTGPGEAGSQEADKQQRQWFEESQANRDLSNRENRHEAERDQEDRNCGYTRRRDRPTFSHYSSKPQMYDTMSQYPMRNFSMCPPPPPPPPPLINQPQQHPPQQPPANYYYHQNARPY